jgi:List-Bact-rpt repeat protein
LPAGAIIYESRLPAVFVGCDYGSYCHEFCKLRARSQACSYFYYPPAATFLTPDPSGQIIFTALGTFIHPPDTRDITSQVTWQTDIPQLITISGGVVSPQPGNVCGIANISASLKDRGNLVIGFATVTVDDPTNPVCPGGSQSKGVVTVALAGTGTGSVTSSPSGINCPTQACGAQFNVGDTIVLTATPNAGFTFGGWQGCTSTNGNACSVLVQTGSTNTVATFNWSRVMACRA